MNDAVATKTWIRVCAVDDLPPGEATVVDRHPAPPIAVYNVDGEFLASDDTCSHAKSSLAEDGYIDGDVVECALHFATFCLRTGRVLSAPANQDLETFAIRIDEGTSRGVVGI